MKKEFKGKKEYLSNMYKSTIKIGNITFPSVENAYQASKCKHKEEIKQFINCSPQDARRLGRQVEMDKNFNRNEIMYCLLKIKFQNNKLAKKLANEKGELVEYNSWHDNYWGHCTCEKCANTEHKNMLGKMLMILRDKLKEEETNNMKTEFIKSKSIKQAAYYAGKGYKEIELPNNFNINQLDLQGLIHLYNINKNADVYLNNTLVNKDFIMKSIRNRLHKMADDNSVIINVDYLIGSPYYNMVAVRAIIADEYNSSFILEKSDGPEEYYSSWAAKKNYNPFTHKWDVELHAEIEEEINYKYYSKLPQFAKIFITSNDDKVLSSIKMKYIKDGKLVNPNKETQEQKENRIHEFLMEEVAITDHSMNKVVEEKDYNKLFNIFGYNMFISKREELIEFVKSSIKFTLPEINNENICYLCEYIIDEYDTATLLEYMNLEKLDLYYEYVNDIQVGKEELLDALLMGEDIEDDYYIDILDDEE